MNTEYDFSFENMRLLKLSDKFLAEKIISGKITFRSLNHDHSIDSIRFTFNEYDYIYLKESGFNELIINLLDNFSSYRYQFNIKPYSGGIISVEESKLTIAWLDDKTIESLFK